MLRLLLDAYGLFFPAKCLQDLSCDGATRGLNDSFKWLFYGDDDTVFFLEGAMNIVEDLDPNMPYFLTGAPCLP